MHHLFKVLSPKKIQNARIEQYSNKKNEGRHMRNSKIFDTLSQ